MKKEKNTRWLATGLNILNAALVAVSIASYFTGTGDGNMSVAGTKCFMFFTIDSNVLAAISSVIIIPFLCRKEAPTWAVVLKYVGTVAVTVTFLTVVFFLGPTQGYKKMFEGICLYLHLICPLLSIASVYLPEIRKPLPKLSWIFGTLPVVVYGALYCIMVLITRRWADFYGFNRGGFWYISLAAMFILSALLSLFMAFLQRKAVSPGKEAADQ